VSGIGNPVVSDPPVTTTQPAPTTSTTASPQTASTTTSTTEFPVPAATVGVVCGTDLDAGFDKICFSNQVTFAAWVDQGVAFAASLPPK